jgi:hypothetical protein
VAVLEQLVSETQDSKTRRFEQIRSRKVTSEMPQCRPDSPNTGTLPLSTSVALNSRMAKLLKTNGLRTVHGPVSFGRGRALPCI